MLIFRAWATCDYYYYYYYYHYHYYYYYYCYYYYYYYSFLVPFEKTGKEFIDTLKELINKWNNGSEMEFIALKVAIVLLALCQIGRAHV